MPVPRRELSSADVHAFMRDRCFAPSPAMRVAAEVEWLTFGPNGERRLVDDLADLLEGLQLPGGSSITFEPGGQIELSSATLPDCGAVVSALDSDCQVLREKCAEAGITLAGHGLDPRRPEQRVNTADRYAAMEAFFDRRSRSGRRMMTNTAAIHVNLDIGPPDLLVKRWHLAHRLGPVLIAIFANSPVASGVATGWRSARMGAWSDIDPSRTAPVDDGSDDPASSWADYAMGAELMLIRTADGCEAVEPGITFGSWMKHGHPTGWPDAGDLEYHLTTLFPPVRPRGWLELRMLDMLPDPWWKVAIAVTTALMDDPTASAVAWDVCAPIWNLWTPSAREAIAHPLIGDAARECFEAAIDALGSIGINGGTADLVTEYRDRYLAANRTPADDILDSISSSPHSAAV